MTNLQFKRIAFDRERRPTMKYLRHLNDAPEEVVFPGKGAEAAPVGDDFFNAMQAFTGLAIEYGHLDESHWGDRGMILGMSLKKQDDGYGISLTINEVSVDGGESHCNTFTIGFISAAKLTSIDQVAIEEVVNQAEAYLQDQSESKVRQLKLVS